MIRDSHGIHFNKPVQDVVIFHKADNSHGKVINLPYSHKVEADRCLQGSRRVDSIKANQETSHRIHSNEEVQVMEMVLHIVVMVVVVEAEVVLKEVVRIGILLLSLQVLLLVDLVEVIVFHISRRKDAGGHCID